MRENSPYWESKYQPLMMMESMVFWCNNIITPAEIADKICELLQNNSLREKMGAAGYQKVLEKYTWDKLAEKIEAAYRQVLQG